jgi:hypothetical protein
VAPELALDRDGQLAQRAAERARVALVGDGHVRAARRAQLRRRDPGATETDHQHALVGEVGGTPLHFDDPASGP